MLSPSAALETQPAKPSAATFPRPAFRESVPAAPSPGWPTLTLLALAFAWCYWPTFLNFVDRWTNLPRHSHGFLIPVFALVVLFARRPKEWPAWQHSAWGLPIVAAALLVRFLALWLDSQPLDGVSLLFMLTGVVLLVGGRNTLRWTWPAIAFVVFMIPLPFFIEMALTHPLQRFVTSASTFLLQTAGLPAIAEGNIIIIEQTRLAIVEACCGVGMLMTFLALSIAVALIVRAPLADRWVIVASAIPIAIVANIVRVTATSWAYHEFSADDSVRPLIHDLAGWLMMPLALALLWLELKYLRWLFIPLNRHDPVLGLPAAASRTSLVQTP